MDIFLPFHASFFIFKYSFSSIVFLQNPLQRFGVLSQICLLFLWPYLSLSVSLYSPPAFCFFATRVFFWPAGWHPIYHSLIHLPQVFLLFLLKNPYYTMLYITRFPPSTLCTFLYLHKWRPHHFQLEKTFFLNRPSTLCFLNVFLLSILFMESKSSPTT